MAKDVIVRVRDDRGCCPVRCSHVLRGRLPGSWGLFRRVVVGFMLSAWHGGVRPGVNAVKFT
jgi:hypothetical protein